MHMELNIVSIGKVMFGGFGMGLSSLRLDDVVRDAQHQGNGLRPMLSPRFDLWS